MYQQYSPSSSYPHDWLQADSAWMPDSVEDPQSWDDPFSSSSEGLEEGWMPNEANPPQSWGAISSTSYPTNGLQPGSTWTPEVAPTPECWGAMSTSDPRGLPQPYSGWMPYGEVLQSWGAPQPTPYSHPHSAWMPGNQIGGTPSAPVVSSHSPTWPHASQGLVVGDVHGMQRPQNHGQLASASSEPERPLPGTCVPQETYTHITRKNWTKHSSIQFNLVNSRYAGVRLVDLTSKSFDKSQLVDWTSPFPQTNVQTFSLRILWPGYPQRSKPLATLDWGVQKREPKTRAKLAQEVAKAVQEHIQHLRDSNSPPKTDVGRWDPRFIRVERLFVVELRHMSKNSWQPVICMQE